MLSAAGANLEAESPVESGAESEEESVWRDSLQVAWVGEWQSQRVARRRVRLWYVGSA